MKRIKIKNKRKERCRMKKLRTTRERIIERRIIRMLEAVFGLGLIGTLAIDILRNRGDENAD